MNVKIESSELSEALKGRINLMKTLKTQRALLDEKHKRDLRIGYNGGMFTADSQRLSTLWSEVKLCDNADNALFISDVSYTTNVVIFDDNDRPISLTRKEMNELIALIQERMLIVNYKFERAVMRLNKSRDVGKLIDEQEWDTMD